jgi:tryptophanyl-tRNA synthetase
MTEEKVVVVASTNQGKIDEFRQMLEPEGYTVKSLKDLPHPIEIDETGKTFEEIEKEFEGQGYGVFKPAVGEAVVDCLTPIREEAKRLIADKAYLDNVYKEGAQKASYIANKTLRKVYKKVGFYQL